MKNGSLNWEEQLEFLKNADILFEASEASDKI